MGKPAAAAARPKTKRHAGNGIWNHAIVAIAIAGIGLVCSVLVLWWQLVASANDAHVEQQAELLSQAYAGYFNGRIAELNARIGAMAEAEAVVQATTSGSAEQMATVSAALPE